jgi:prephenate dehydrogenase
MEDGFRLQESTIAIVGLGLMGGSLALALRGKCARLYGIDSDPATLKLARDRRIVDQADRHPAGILAEADLVILATPVPAIIDLIPRLPDFIHKPCILLDLGSTKRDILQAMGALPERFDPIGGHPICGKEKLGLENAEAALFRDAPFVITPLERTTVRARTAAQQIIQAVEARGIEMDAADHDRALAFTSHLPFLVASALALAVPTELAPYIGSGFRSTSRLAGTPSSMMLGILRSNRGNILRAISMFQERLSDVQTSLTQDDVQALERLLGNARSAYQQFLSGS